ncbi:MAG: ABC transporter ATP-binding protein [Clostridia bacterium]|nr:ABC transporter ATP-binding protein [Clostridia bacterium]
MTKIFKNMRPHWKSILLIILLLFIQAICDLSLPNYTSNIIDVGIQNSGIEYATPTVIRASEYGKINYFMTNDEKSLWESSYSIGTDGNYHIKDSSKENLEKLDNTFTTPIVVYHMISQMSQSNAKAPSAQTVSQATMPTAMPSPTDIRAKFEEQMKTMGSTMIHSSAIAFTKNEYKAVGIDLDKMQTDYLWKSGSMMLGATLVMITAAIFVCLLAAKVGASIGKDSREKVFKTVVGFSNNEMDKFSTASLITRSTNDIQQVQMASTLILRMLFYAPILAIGGIIMVFRTNAGMEWIIALAVIVLACIVGLLMTIAMPKFKIMQILVDKVNLVSREILTGLPVIRAFGREELEESRFDEANKSLTKTMLFTNRVMTFMMPIMMLLMNGISVLIVWIASHKIDAGVLEVGSMTAFITYSMIIIMSFLILTMFSIMLPRASVAANRIDEVTSTELSIADKENPFTPKEFNGVITFKNVSFKYPNAEDSVLKSINFEALPGQTTAIIGSTGCGKSTLINLIPRLYDVTEGEIMIDGVDVRYMKQSDLRDQIGFVPQKGILFSGTIESNIRFSAPNLTDDEIKEVAQISQASNFIEEKSDSYKSSISQGGNNVSGGQKQRLAIARAIAKNPKIYIFDDSFSALDFQTDIALRKALEPKVKDCTVLIVAQRVSTIMHADQILVIEDGYLVGKGTHAELLKSCEVYSQIAKSQLSEKELEANYTGKESK